MRVLELTKTEYAVEIPKEYVSSQELDQPPEVLHYVAMRPSWKISHLASRATLSEKIEVRAAILVGIAGEVEGVLIFSSNLQLAEAPVIEALCQWQFTPSQLDGKPARFYAFQTVYLDLQ